MHPAVTQVTDRIIRRSQGSRQGYLRHMDDLGCQSPHRATLAGAGVVFFLNNNKRRKPKP